MTGDVTQPAGGARLGAEAVRARIGGRGYHYVMPDTAVRQGAGTLAREVFEAQRRSFLADGPPSVAVRRARMDKLLSAILDNSRAVVEAIGADFGQRSAAATLGTDILGPLSDVLYTRRHVGAWSRPRRVGPGLHSLGGVRAWVEPRPLGVVGIMAPWNFPVTLALQPAFAALAAGNRVMIKVSEVTPRTAECLRNIIVGSFDFSELAVVVGDAAVAAHFSALPFDHLLFTGSPAVGKRVQRVAADNLTPVTLELGGKNPAVVARDAKLELAAARIAAGRMTNAGQLCLCPDYALVPRDLVPGFLRAVEASLRKTWPSIAGNPQYPWVVNEQNYVRLQSLLTDAVDKGAELRQIAPAGEPPSTIANRWMPPTLVSRVTDDMRLAHEEVFGPVLSVVPYDTVDDVVSYVADRPSPLAAYWFGSAGADYRTFSSRVSCGGLTRNDFAVHALPNGAPFGGVGNSGSGYYHGRSGFDTFSHLRCTAQASTRFSMMTFATPPFSPRTEAAMDWSVRALRRVTRGLAARSQRAADREAARALAGR